MSWRQRMADALQVERRVQAPLLVAALLRIALMVAAFAITGTTVMTQGDTASYLNPGRNLILHGAFATAGAPEIDRTPGYPLFAEITGMAWNNVLLTVTIQIALSLISLLLVRRIADRIFPNRNAGIVAAWLYTIEPLSIVYTARLMPETLFILLLLLAIDRMLAYQSSGKLTVLALTGLSLAAATYVRPVSYYLVFPFAAGLAMITTKHGSLRWKAPLLLLIVVLPLLAAWQLRNFEETGYSGFSSIVEKNLYFFQSAEVTAELRHISLESEQKTLGYPEDKYYLGAHPEQRSWSQSQRLHFMRAQATKTLAAHPGLYLQTHFAGMGLVAFTPCATELLQLIGKYPPSDAMPHRILNEGILNSTWRVILSHPTVAITMAILEGFLLFLYGSAMRSAIRGCLSPGSPNSLRPALLTIAGVALYFLLISGGAQAVGRYRLPVMPELCILAAGGLTLSRKKKTAEP